MWIKGAVLGLLAVAALAFAAAATAKEQERNGSRVSQISNRQLIVESHSYMTGHPDQRWRRAATAAYRAGRGEDAFRDFLRAARFADKPSQAVIAQAYWLGELGQTRNRPLAYAWMDLAAERGYRDFLAQRERYWQQLTEEERQLAVEAGQAVYAEYGDQAAKPRHRREMMRSRLVSPRSRTEMHDHKVVMLGGGQTGSGQRVFGHQFYDDEHWDPVLYWDVQDDLWHAPPKGRIDILPLRPLTEDEMP